MASEVLTNQMEEANTDAILAVAYRKILVKEPKALLPVIGCLSTLPLSGRGQVKARNVAWASSSVDDGTDMPVLVQSLLRNGTDSAAATKALQAIRVEIATDGAFR